MELLQVKRWKRSGRCNWFVNSKQYLTKKLYIAEIMELQLFHLYTIRHQSKTYTRKGDLQTIYSLFGTSFRRVVMANNCINSSMSICSSQSCTISDFKSHQIEVRTDFYAYKTIDVIDSLFDGNIVQLQLILAV